MRSLVRRTVGVVAVVTAVAAAFTVGVHAGRDGARADAAPEPARAGGTLDEAADRIAGQGLRPVARKALDAAAIAAMLRAAGDRWGSWSALSAPMDAGGYAGVGVWLQTGHEGGLVVAQVSPGSAAAAAGVRPGDELRSVAGRTASSLSAGMAAAALRGRTGSSVTAVLRRGHASRMLRLVRAGVGPAGVAVSVEAASAGRAAGPGVGRITVPSFSRGVGRSVRDGAERLRRQRATGLVLDLRGDPGGLLDEAVETASAFLDGGQVVTYVRRDGHPQRLDAVGRGDTTTPLVVLVDGGTASAAEVVAAALQDRGRAVLVGSRTFGKGSVQEPAQLSDGSRLELTVARYATPGGRSLEGVGLQPDIEVAPGSDPQVALRRGVEVLGGLLADTTARAGGRG